MSLALHTLITKLSPPGRGIHLTEVTIEDESVRLQLTAIAPTALCPDCAVPSSSIHSRYQRHLTDLPWGTRLVRIQLMVRKFVCRHVSCARRICRAALPGRRGGCTDQPADPSLSSHRAGAPGP